MFSLKNGGIISNLAKDSGTEEEGERVFKGNGVLNFKVDWGLGELSHIPTARFRHLGLRVL